MKKFKKDSYDYEEDAKKRKYKNPDDMLRTVPGVDPMRYKRGVVGLVMGIASFIIAFIPVLWVWMVSFLLASAGLGVTAAQRKIKKTKISTAGLALTITGVIVLAALIILALSGIIKLTNLSQI